MFKTRTRFFHEVQVSEKTLQPKSDSSSDTVLNSGRESPLNGGRLGRLKLGECLGRGGMGQVFAGEDPYLKRSVAVKFLLNGSPRDIRRFVREGQAQAAQTHPNICPVYEAGEEDGTPYIVMKRIDGRTLDRAAADMALENKLDLLRTIAEAVHAAHRTGLVHRDLKPSNILVESVAEGGEKPYVLDFGLARPIADGGVTLEGEALGTPGYMAPEQVRGAQQEIDRRTDVYALGATLYHLLAGTPPFAHSHLGPLQAILEEEPRSLAPRAIPRDVEAIVFKCLEKEPARRYRSAQALAEDLGRYLDDVPVQARANSRGYRFLKWARRNRSLVQISSGFAALLLVTLAWGGFTAWQANTRERLAREVTRQVEEMEAFSRYSRMAPLHDIRPDLERLRERMEGIREGLRGQGAWATAAGHFALGQGFLSLEAPREAYVELETAWRRGYRGPDVASALARALSLLYLEGLAAAELVSDWESRQGRLRQLEEKYGEPARRFLHQSGEGGSPGADRQPFLAALLPFHEGRFDEALALLRESQGRRAWSFELDTLEGDILRTRAIQHHAEGRPEAARDDLEAAFEAYDRAAKIAPSDPAVARAVAMAATLYGVWEMLGASDLQAILDRGLESTRRALVAHPEDARAWLWQARVQRLKAQSLRARSQDPIPTLERAVFAARQATDLLAESSVAFLELGRVHWGRAQWLREKGEDPTGALAETIAAFDRVVPEERDYLFYTYLGLAHMTRGDHRQGRGEEAVASFDQAVRAYRAAAERHSRPLAALNNLGVCQLKKSHLLPTEHQIPTLRQAIDAFERAQVLDPNHVAPPYYLGQSYLLLAQGGNPASGLLGDAVHHAIKNYRRALELNPQLVPLHNALGEIHQLQAVHAWEVGRDPEPFFDLARAALASAMAASPQQDAVHQNLAWVAYFEAKIWLRDGEAEGPLGAALDEAQGHVRRALELSTQPGALLCLGSIHRLRAEAAVASGGDPTPWFQAAEKTFHELLVLNPRHAEAHRSLGRLWTLEARWSIGRGDLPEGAFLRARESLDQALQLEPDVAYFYLARAKWADVRHRWQAAPEVLSEGLLDAERALSLRPGWPEALRLRDALGPEVATEPGH